MSNPPTTSRSTASHSITKRWLIAVKPRGDRIRCASVPPETDMSIAACPSMYPRRPRSACARASATSRRDATRRSTSASTTIMIGPPTNSAAVNCQPIRIARMMPSSITRLVDAISNAIAAVKSAPFWKSDRASATAAYEQDELAAPRSDATASVRGESSGRSRLMRSFGTTACTTADRVNPSMRAQRISQVIANEIDSARPTAPTRSNSACAGREHPAMAFEVLDPVLASMDRVRLESGDDPRAGLDRGGVVRLDVVDVDDEPIHDHRPVEPLRRDRAVLGVRPRALVGVVRVTDEDRRAVIAFA